MESIIGFSWDRRIQTEGPLLGYVWNHCTVKINYFSHIPILHLAMYCIIFVGDVTEVDAYTVNEARFTNQLETANKQHNKQ